MLSAPIPLRHGSWRPPASLCDDIDVVEMKLGVAAVVLAWPASTPPTWLWVEPERRRHALGHPLAARAPAL